MPVAPASGESPRHPGSVAFDWLIPDENGTALIVFDSQIVTQDKFVRLIISGPIQADTYAPL